MEVAGVAAKAGRSRLCQSFAEAQDGAHSLGTTYWVENLGSLLTALRSTGLQGGPVWGQGDGSRAFHPK